MRKLVFGTDGQLARSFVEKAPDAIFISRERADFRYPERLAVVLDEYRPDVVINPAAYTEVDRAETDRESAELINAGAPSAIAQWCAKNSRALVHYSTDYIYAGTGETPWRENDAAKPVNHYGATKWRGEEGIRASGCRHLILRTSWVFSPWGKNFVRTMLRLGESKTELGIVADQVGSPTYAPDLAEVSLAMIEHPRFTTTSGTYNVCNAGLTSWFEFAKETFRIARARGQELRIENVKPLTSAEYPTPAARPLNSRLDTSKLYGDFGLKLRPWTEALSEALNRLDPKLRTNCARDRS